MLVITDKLFVYEWQVEATFYAGAKQATYCIKHVPDNDYNTKAFLASTDISAMLKRIDDFVHNFEENISRFVSVNEK